MQVGYQQLIVSNILVDIGQFHKTPMNLCKDLGTNLGKVLWKIGSSLCSKSPLFKPLIPIY